MRIILSLAFCCLTIPSLGADDNWPQFRGPSGDGHASARDLPTEWSESKNIRWKTPIHDKGWSSPVIWGDRIWLTTAREDGKEMFAICVDRKTGKIVHDVKLFAVEKPDFCIDFNSYASPTPVAEDGRVYVHFGRYGTACLDAATAKVLWERQDLPCNHWRGPGSSPILVGDLLILTFDGYDLQYLAALDKHTGKTVWKKDREIKYTSDNGDLHKAYSTPSVLEVAGKKQLVSPSAQATIAYDPATGEELWRINHGGMNAASRPVFGHGLLFLTSGHTTQLWAVKQGGSGELNQDNVAWTINRGVPSRPSLLLIGDYLYLVSDQGFVSCVEARTGKQLWQERLGANCSSSPIFASGLIYIADEKGTTHVIEPGTEFKKVASNKLDQGCMASPAAVGDAIHLRTRTHLYCIGK
jgi:hypothetical protein